jgi:UDP-N-acetylglucosamine 4,6-dehydratase
MTTNILITGGTGFLGRELISHLIKNKKNNIIAFGRTESKLSELPQHPRIKPVCGDIRDYEALYFACKENNVDKIIHAAAMKRIDTCQDFPIEACKTNIDGTINCIKVCKEFGTSLFFISTDKACEPCTTYGATKYLAEQLVRRESQSHDFLGCIIRYGNVLNSTGSVLNIWVKQYKETRKVKVRDKSMTRFFWYVEDSVTFIENCLDKIIIEKGQVFIPKIKALNIYEMACYLYREENVEVTTCSHTEKIHESLNGDYCSKDHVVHPRQLLRNKTAT